MLLWVSLDMKETWKFVSPSLLQPTKTRRPMSIYGLFLLVYDWDNAALWNQLACQLIILLVLSDFHLPVLWYPVQSSLSCQKGSSLYMRPLFEIYHETIWKLPIPQSRTGKFRIGTAHAEIKEVIAASTFHCHCCWWIGKVARAFSEECNIG